MTLVLTCYTRIQVWPVRLWLVRRENEIVIVSVWKMKVEISRGDERWLYNII